jgi:hypothetical protein
VGSIAIGKLAAYQESDHGRCQQRWSWVVFDQTLDIGHHAPCVAPPDLIRGRAKFVGSRMRRGGNFFSAWQISRLPVQR